MSSAAFLSIISFSIAISENRHTDCYPTSSEHGSEDDPAGPDVCRLGFELRLAEQLWCHVGKSPAQPGQETLSPFVAKHGGEAKVRQLQVIWGEEWQQWGTETVITCHSLSGLMRVVFPHLSHPAVCSPALCLGGWCQYCGGTPGKKTQSRNTINIHKGGQIDIQTRLLHSPQLLLAAGKTYELPFLASQHPVLKWGGKTEVRKDW